jgi:biphenyl-2,3-diol 1,2-dioxygenase
MDSREWRIAVNRGANDDLVFAGFEVNDAAALAEIVASLKSIDVETNSDPELPKTRRDASHLHRSFWRRG